MKCPHCNKESKARVLESRKINGEVWRIRTCGMCLKTFVSREITSTDMKFPWGPRKRERTAKSKPVLVAPTRPW